MNHELGSNSIPKLVAGFVRVRRNTEVSQLQLRTLYRQFIIPILMLCAVFAAAPVFGQNEVDPVKSASAGLKKTKGPWYDAKSDSIRRIEVKTKIVKRDEIAERRVKKPSWLSLIFIGIGNLFDAIAEFLGSLGQFVFWFLIAVVLLSLGAAVIWVVTKIEAKKTSQSELIKVVDSGSDVERVEALPFKVDRPRGDLLSEARRQYELGNYREAIIYLFSYKLVQLDKHQFIRLTKGKTNRQYLREVRPLPRVCQLLQGTMYVFEDVFFGDHDIDKPEFEACWNVLDEFHSLVHGGATA